MSHKLSRRGFLGSTAALGACAMLPSAAFTATTEPRLLTIDQRVIEVGGRAAEVYAVMGAGSKPGLVLEAGERFNVRLDNRSGVETIIHWHGQVPAPELDGVHDTGYVGPMAPGEARTYEFDARPGTHWMHAHHGLLEQQLMAAPLIVRSREDEAADAQDVAVLLHDFTFRDPEEILAELTGGMGGMGHGAMGHGNMAMGAMGADLNDVEYDAYLANDRTLDDPEVISVEQNGRVRLRLINGATATAFWIDLGEVVGTLVAVDGNAVEPVKGRRFPLTQAQRIDLMIDVPAGSSVAVLAQREGDRPRTGVILAAPGAAIPRIAGNADAPAPAVDLSLEWQLRAANGLAKRTVGRHHSVMLMGDMSSYAWNFNGTPWGQHKPFEVAAGERVEIELMNHSMMAHPIHLHGHHFQVTAIDGQALDGAVRDTILVPAMGRVSVAFDADNPGRWLIHCHNLYHMAVGMMAEVRYV